MTLIVSALCVSITVLIFKRKYFSRKLSQFFGEYAEDFSDHMYEMREHVGKRIRPKPIPTTANGCDPHFGAAHAATREQPMHTTRPASVCRPQLKYLPIDDPQAEPHAVPLSRIPFKVGRAMSCDLSIQDDTLSHEHFEIIVRGESYGVRNLSTTNGIVLVNEETNRVGTRLCEAGRIQMIDPELGYLRFWAGGLFFQLTLADSTPPSLM